MEGGGETAVSPAGSGTRADSTAPDTVIVDTGGDVTGDTGVTKVKKKRRKKPREVWYTRKQISEL